MTREFRGDPASTGKPAPPTDSGARGGHAASTSGKPGPSPEGGGRAGYRASSPELERWLARHIEQGFGAEALVLSMLRSGYDAAFARDTVAAAIRQPTPAHASHNMPVSQSEASGGTGVAGASRATGATRGGGAATASQGTAATMGTAGTRPSATPAATPAGTGSGAAAASGRNAIHHLGREIPIVFALEAPRVLLLQNLLSDAECDALVALSRGRLERSPVVNPDTGDENLIDARTSMGAMFQVGEHSLIERIEARIAAVTGVPVDHGEGLQILNYKPGGEYQPHFDFFNPQRPGEARQLRVGGQRIATLVIYLNSPPAGGATAFPRVGLEVAPIKGNAVFFSYRLPDGTLDERTLHAGLPVEAGEKWIATKWLRELPYRSKV